MTLTKPMLRAVYTMLLAMPPFNRWRIPPADEVKFDIISRRHKCYADYEFVDGLTHHIRVSRRTNTLPLLVAKMAHEMGHLRQDSNGPTPVVKPHFGHGPDFQLIADRICSQLGFDRIGF